MPEFEKRICVTGLTAPVAESVNVTVLLFVTAAFPLITTVPVGAGAPLLTRTSTLAAVAKLAAASQATADSACGPLSMAVESHVIEKGAPTASPSGAPSRKN